MMIGGGTITELNDLRGPMAAVITSLAEQMTELQRYRAMFGPLPPENSTRPPAVRPRTHSHSRHQNRHTVIHEVDEDEAEVDAHGPAHVRVHDDDDDDGDAGSDTEQE